MNTETFIYICGGFAFLCIGCFMLALARLAWEDVRAAKWENRGK